LVVGFFPVAFVFVFLVETQNFASVRLGFVIINSAYGENWILKGFSASLWAH